MKFFPIFFSEIPSEDNNFPILNGSLIAIIVSLRIRKRGIQLLSGILIRKRSQLGSKQFIKFKYKVS